MRWQRDWSTVIVIYILSQGVIRFNGIWGTWVDNDDFRAWGYRRFREWFNMRGIGISKRKTSAV